MADDTVRRSRTGRTVVVAVGAWLAVVVVASALAWFAIGRAGSEVLDPSAEQVPTSTTSDPATSAPAASDPATSVSSASTPSVSTPSASGTSAGTAAPTSAATSSAPTTSAPPAATAVDEVSTVAGGQAGFRCTGEALTLRFAQPATGWSVRQDSSDGGARIRVEFESDQDRFRIEAVCSGGEPSVRVESDDAGSGAGDDD